MPNANMHAFSNGAVTLQIFGQLITPTFVNFMLLCITSTTSESCLSECFAHLNGTIHYTTQRNSKTVCLITGRVMGLLLMGQGWSGFDLEIITGNGSVVILSFAGAGLQNGTHAGL